LEFRVKLLGNTKGDIHQTIDFGALEDEEADLEFFGKLKVGDGKLETPTHL